jgi:DNA-directed RNA polymerase specialized sigma24 family protein
MRKAHRLVPRGVPCPQLQPNRVEAAYIGQVVLQPEGDNVTSVAAGLVVQARAGDEEAFARLLGHALPHAYGLAFAMLGSRTAAEDAVQDASLKAWRKLHQLRDGTPLRPWFLGIVANECRNLKRGGWGRWRQLLPLGSGVDAPVERGDPDGALDVRRAMASLKLDDRLVLLLRYYLDLSVDDVARTLGLSDEAVKSRSHRAVNRLRKALGPKEKGRQ